MAGFTFRYRLSGGAPTIQTFKFKDSETLTKGDMVSIESGVVDLAATADAVLAGIALQTKAGTTAVSTIDIITDADAVYGVVDANARLQGALLDIAGATGAMSVTTDSNHDVLVVAGSSATEETLVTFNVAKHWLT
jgi:methionine aminopeptidase